MQMTSAPWLRTCTVSRGSGELGEKLASF